MAVYYFRNTGNVNWGIATNWSLTDGGGATGAIPTAADDAYFTSNSGNCTVNASARVCKSLVFSGVGAGNYAGTITMTNAITVSGNVTLSATMTIAGGGDLIINATGTMISNGKTWPNRLVIGGTSQTYTLADNWIITGNILFNGGTSSVINQTTTQTLTINGSLNIQTGGLIVSGTATIILAGTGSVSTGTGQLRNNLTINTSGTITLSGSINYNTGTLTYTSGTVITTGSTLNVSANTTIDTNGITWDNVTINSGTINLTLSSNLNISGTFTCSGQGGALTLTFSGVGLLNLSGGFATSIVGVTGVATITITLPNDVTVTSLSYAPTGSTLNRRNVVLNGAKNITVNGNVSIAYGNTSTFSGNCNLIFAGTGNFYIDGNNPFAVIYSLPTVINTTGTCTFTTTVTGGNATSPMFTSTTVTYLSGTLAISGTGTNQVVFSGCTLNLNSGGIWTPDVNIRGTNTLLSNANFKNVTTQTTNAVINGSSFTMNVSGNLSINIATSGTASINFNGGNFQTWSHTSLISLTNNLSINKQGGTLTLSGNIYYNTGTLTYVSGEVIAKNSNLFVTLATTFINCNRLFFETVTITSGITITMNEFFGGKPTKKPIIQASSTTNYIVQFQDSFEKICKFVDIRNCTLSKRGQLLSLTDVRRKGTNLGIRYINQSPNGVPKNIKFANEETYLANSLVSDPTKN
jgi:fibronectin-binding autotransporter adhesin